MTESSATEACGLLSERGAQGASVSVLILARNEADNLDRLLPALAELLELEGVGYELVVVDAASPDNTAEVSRRHGARTVQQERPGYANALRQGFRCCSGDFVLALDADQSHRPEFIGTLFAAMDEADLVIASRYVTGGSAVMPASRRLLSLMLNRTFSVALGVPIRDLSSGFRLYRASLLREIETRGDHFDVLPELAALAVFGGRRVVEVPFRYHPREAGVSKARVLAFGPSYLRTLVRCWLARRASTNLPSRAS